MQIIEEVAQKTGGFQYFVISSEDVKISYDQKYDDLFFEKLSKNLLDTVFDKMFDKNNFDEIYENNKHHSKEQFISLLKLALLIPRIWYGYIY